MTTKRDVHQSSERAHATENEIVRQGEQETDPLLARLAARHAENERLGIDRRDSTEIVREALGGSAWVAANLADVFAAVTLRPPTPVLLDRAVEIAERLNQPASYDAQYAALAEAEGCGLWTADGRFWNAASPRYPWVRWVGEVAAPGPPR